AYNCHYYEFIPEAEADKPNPEVVLAHELEKDQKYELVVTTGGGLYRYRTEDVLRVVGIQGGIPQLSFQYRLGKTSSMTGEKLTEAQVSSAMNATDTEKVFKRKNFFVYARTGQRPHYSIMSAESNVNNTISDHDLLKLVSDFQHNLCEVNGEYADKCASLRLGSVGIVLVKDSDFEKLHLQFRAKHVSDDQYKPGILRCERDLEANMTILRQAIAP
ncbi:MAG: GH3 auxin-responsive promoter family protein, partial [Pseudomonadota bacterium]